MKTFLQSVGAVLTNGLKANIQLQGMGDGNIKLMYTPDIGPTPENASEAVVQLRAAISKPMVVTGTPMEIEEAFANLIGDKSAVVARGLSALDEIERLAASAVAEAKAKPSAKPAAAAAPVPVGDDEDEHDACDNEVGTPAPAAGPAVSGASAASF